MIIVGDWLLCPDGVHRPVVSGTVHADGASLRDIVFLIDSGADRSVFIAPVLRRLNLPAAPPPADYHLVGVGGSSAFVLVRAVVELTRDDGGLARIRGEFAAFLSPTASDFCVLGRDVLDNFDVILSRRRGQVLLLAPNHHYQVAKT
jgi:hypothetical protein